MNFASRGTVIVNLTENKIGGPLDIIGGLSRHFEQFLDSEIGVPLLVDHGPLINSWGVTPSVGTARWFAPVTYPVTGLVCLAELDYADGWGDSLLHDIDSIRRQRWLPAACGMSIGAFIEDDVVLPIEVSLTRTPAFEDARVFAVGVDAMATWELLTSGCPGIDGTALVALIGGVISRGFGYQPVFHRTRRRQASVQTPR
jgi:hypothetical protein